MRPIASLLAVAALTAGLFLACGGGLGTPASSLLGEDPLPNSGDPAGSSTDPPGSSTDPSNPGNCVCPVGRWDCGGALDTSVNVSSQNGVCTAGKDITIDPCTGRFTVQGVSGTIKLQGDGLYVCLGTTCGTCTLKPVTDDGGTLDTGVKDTGTDVKDTGIVDAPKDVAKDVTPVCTSFCSVNSECQSTCPAAVSGYFNCCDQASNSCYQDTACPGP